MEVNNNHSQYVEAMQSATEKARPDAGPPPARALAEAALSAAGAPPRPRRDVPRQPRAGGPKLAVATVLDPVRYGDWEKDGIASDF